MDLFSTESYQFPLPEELIAQYPCTPRDSSRLMIVDRKTGNITDCIFRDIIDYLDPGDRLIFNDTRVIPARLYGRKESGAAVEVLLHRMRSDGAWEALARPGRKLQAGTRILFGDDFSCVVEAVLEDGQRLIRFDDSDNFAEKLQKYGQMPLPHYIKREAEASLDDERYQTVYAANPGAVAAPTAGLHFTDELLQRCMDKGVTRSALTLHVGLGTFKPVQVSDIRDHPMHYEQVIVSDAFAAELNGPSAGKDICVGTTSCRALESVAEENGMVQPGQFDTNIFIYPGYRFKRVNHLLTNFHLPGSTLLMLISAFGGYELVMEAYKKAVRDRYRFFSYGDAMLLL